MWESSSSLQTDLYFIGSDRSVWTFSPTANFRWQFSRLSACQRAKNVFVLTSCGKGGKQEGWVVQDLSPGARGAVIGQPVQADASGDERNPPLGRWLIWDQPFTLADRPPREPGPPGALPVVVEAPFGSMTYNESGRSARIELVLKGGSVTDEALEEMLGKVATLLRNLAQRPSMALFIRSDARAASVPAVRHVRRFLAFMQELGPEFVLAGRGSAIVLSAQGLLGQTLLSMIRMVERMLPPPWPESLESSMEDADRFLEQLAREHVASVPVASPRASFSFEPECPAPGAEGGGLTRVAVALADEKRPWVARTTDEAEKPPDDCDADVLTAEPEGRCQEESLANSVSTSSVSLSAWDILFGCKHDCGYHDRAAELVLGEPAGPLRGRASSGEEVSIRG